MPDRKGATLLEDLPEEIVHKILIRLPSKDVGRCRAVSTAWRTATSTHRFMLEHHRRQPSLPIINGDGRPASIVVFPDASNLQLWPFPPSFFKHSSEDRIRGACDGFIIVSRRSLLFLFYIYNPVIRKKAILPKPQVGESFYNHIIGFYQYHPTGEYRVLWVSQLDPFSDPFSQSQHLSESSLYVHTVGAKEPRHVRFRMSIVSSPCAEQRLLKQLSFLIYYPPPVHHLGSLHWCSNGPYIIADTTGGCGNIVVFDTEAESFRWMHSPTQPCASRKLFNMKGTLALCGCSPTVINIWVMQDYESEIWAFKHRIDLSTVEVSRQLHLSSLKNDEKEAPIDSIVEEFNGTALLNEGELLIKFNRKYVLRCDMDGKFLGMVNIGKSQFGMILTQYRLQETIIPIPSHDMHGEDEESPFFAGHV